MPEITVAVVQMDTTLGEQDPNLAKMSDFVRKITAAQKVDLIVFPELATTGYECGVKFTQLTQRVPGPSANVLAQRANEQGIHIAFGMATKERVESILFNSSVLVGPEGDVMSHYRKVHLKGEEQMLFRPGFRLEPVETPIGIIGQQIGWDMFFPEGTRSLCMDGAELILVSAAWPKRPRRRMAHIFVFARRRERLLYFGREPRGRRTCDNVLRREHDHRPAWSSDRGFGRKHRGLHRRQDQFG